MRSKKQFAAANLVGPHRRKNSGPSLVAAQKGGRQHDLTGDRPNLFIPAEKRLAIARERRKTLRRFSRLQKWHSKKKAAQIIGASLTSLWRWKKTFTASGLPGLMPATARCGRHSPFENLRFTKEALRELEMFFIETPFNPSAAWQKFANSPACPPLVARAAQRTGRVPAPMASIGRVSLVQCRCYASADGRRLHIKLPVRGVLTAQIAVPPKFKLVKLTK